jgi:hypothetical protein
VKVLIGGSRSHRLGLWTLTLVLRAGLPSVLIDEGSDHVPYSSDFEELPLEMVVR